MKVIGYARVSTEEQTLNGVSLNAQIAKIKAYCTLYELELIDIIVDGGVSAKSLNRPGLQRALAMLKSGEAAGLVVTKLDRLSRSVGDWDTLIRDFFGERAGKQLFSVGDAVDTRTAAGRLVLNVLMSVAQWERETICERTASAMQHLKANNQTTGQIPFGFRLGPDGKTLVPDPAELEAIGIVLELKARGLSYRRIAAEMNRRGVKTKEAGRWHLATVQRVLRAA